MNAKQCVAILDGLQNDYRPRLRAARTVTEREHWEGFLSALTMAAMMIETAERKERSNEK